MLVVAVTSSLAGRWTCLFASSIANDFFSLLNCVAPISWTTFSFSFLDLPLWLMMLFTNGCIWIFELFLLCTLLRTLIVWACFLLFKVSEHWLYLRILLHYNHVDILWWLPQPAYSIFAMRLAFVLVCSQPAIFLECCNPSQGLYVHLPGWWISPIM